MPGMVDSGFVQFKLDSQTSQKFALGDDPLVESIRAGEHTFEASCYPRYRWSDGEFLSLCLSFERKSRSITSNPVFEAFVVGKDGAPSPSHAKRSTGHNNDCTAGSWKSWCWFQARKLWDNVSADTVADLLACAETYNCQELKDSCMDFFVAEKNFKQAMLTEGFLRLGQKFPTIIAELRKRAGI